MHLIPFLLFLLAVVFVNVGAKPQVPYDYIPIGRKAIDRDKELAGHPSDVVLNYERLYPARRKWIDHNYKFISPQNDDDDK